MNLVLTGNDKYIKFSHLVILAASRSPRDLKLWGLVYVDVCDVFKAIVINFPILGGLFQVYRWALRIL
jgi:hypothetical protein